MSQCPLTLSQRWPRCVQRASVELGLSLFQLTAIPRPSPRRFSPTPPPLVPERIIRFDTLRTTAVEEGSSLAASSFAENSPTWTPPSSPSTVRHPRRLHLPNCSFFADLSDDAQILYSSDSIVDILGHTPDEVVNRSVWQFFHPDELPLAKDQHSRGVRLDKAAVLSYCRLRNRQGDWVGCECCFSVVYDVMVCCTSIYREGMQSQSKSPSRAISASC